MRHLPEPPTLPGRALGACQSDGRPRAFLARKASNETAADAHQDACIHNYLSNGAQQLRTTDAEAVVRASATSPAQPGDLAVVLALVLALALAPATAVQPANAGEEAALLIQRPGCVDQHGPPGVWIRSHPAAQAEDDTHDTQGRRLELRRRPDKHHDAPETRRRRRDQEPEEPEKLEPIEDEKVLVRSVLVSRQPKAHPVTQPENRRSGEEVVQRSLRPVRRRPRGAAQLRRRSADREPALYDALVATVESHLIDCGACAVAEWPWANATFSSDGHAPSQTCAISYHSSHRMPCCALISILYIFFRSG